MLYQLFEYLAQHYSFPGDNLYQFTTFRAGLAILLSLVISIRYGKRIIGMLQKRQVGEIIRDLDLAGQMEKKGTPTMGGIIIILAIIIPTLLFAKLDNVYVQLLILTTLWMGTIGFIDDYIKVFKRDKKGLSGKFKVLGQVVLGLIVGSVMFFHPDVVVQMESKDVKEGNYTIMSIHVPTSEFKDEYTTADTLYNVKTSLTNVPFLKGKQLDYAFFVSFLKNPQKWAWIFFIPLVIFIVTAVSNAANLTDGIDGLATGTSAIIGAVLGIFAYVSGHYLFAGYLEIFYLPYTSEIVIFTGAFLGACIGFLWYNAFPAQVFMGDTGSLALGGIIAALAIMLRKELLIPILCGIFVVENL
ncbi:MAG: phospho-N-acetylmuramoyl-pentapeptide-transferase, partial [Bacteroidota bacterium]